MKGIDALFGKALLALLWYGIGEGPLEGDQFFPVDAQITSNAVPVHPARPIGGLGPADQHLLGIAAAQRAGSAERAMVDNRHRRARAPDARGNHLRGGAGTDDNDVVGVHPLALAMLPAV